MSQSQMPSGYKRAKPAYRYRMMDSWRTSRHFRPSHHLFSHMKIVSEFCSGWRTSTYRTSLYEKIIASERNYQSMDYSQLMMMLWAANLSVIEHEVFGKFANGVPYLKFKRQFWCAIDIGTYPGVSINTGVSILNISWHVVAVARPKPNPDGNISPFNCVPE